MSNSVLVAYTIASQAIKTESDMAGEPTRAGQLSAWPRRLPGRRARVRRQLDRSQQTPNFRSCCAAGARRVQAGARARPGQLAHIPNMSMMDSWRWRSRW